MAEEVLTSADSPLINKSPNMLSSNGITIRRATFLDATAVGTLGAKTYYDTKLSDFVAPYRHMYPTDYERGFIERAAIRMLSPRNRNYVAVLQENGKERVVGSAQFIRLGDDYGARSQIRSNGALGRVILFFMGWLYHFYLRILHVLNGGRRHEDPEALRLFGVWGEEEFRKHWDCDERRDRWHAQSVFVDSEFHRRGIGRALLKEAMTKADEECVCMGLESSTAGELLYRSLGFEVLDRFIHDPFEQGNGGVMIYRPKGFVDRID